MEKYWIIYVVQMFVRVQGLGSGGLFPLLLIAHISPDPHLIQYYLDRRFCMTKILIALFTLILILMAGCSQPPASSSPSSTSSSAASKVISVKDAYDLIQKNKGNLDFVILDVRTADEFNAGHLADAVNIDYYAQDFKEQVNKLDHNKEYLVYCRTANRSASAVKIMLDLGFTRLNDVAGGIVEWGNAGYPTLK
jgi:rhodanese-related sulfurtransferase